MSQAISERGRVTIVYSTAARPTGDECGAQDARPNQAFENVLQIAHGERGLLQQESLVLLWSAKQSHVLFLHVIQFGVADGQAAAPQLGLQLPDIGLTWRPG
jgi:hypothetical protein